MVIGLTGYKGSGKDVFADYLVETRGFIKYSFAKPIKEALKAIFGWTDEDLSDRIKKEQIDPFWGISPRQALQWVGTDVFREMLPKHFPQFGKLIGSDIWVRNFERFYLMNKDKNIVISDMRFANEVSTILKLGGTTIQVLRRSVIPKTFEHKSEDIDSLMGIEIVVPNDNSKQDLHRRIDSLEVFANVG